MGTNAFFEMTIPSRRLVGSAALFCGILILGGWPFSHAATTFSAYYCPLANFALSRHAFGNIGHTRLSPLREVSRQEADNVDADAILALSVDGFEGELPLGISLRRDVYLPALILVALLVAAPIASFSRAICLLLSAAIVWMTSVLGYGLLASWTFATQLHGVYALSTNTQRFVDFAYGALLAPPGNRFIAPLALGALMIGISLRLRASRRTPD